MLFNLFAKGVVDHDLLVLLLSPRKPRAALQLKGENSCMITRRWAGNAAEKLRVSSRGW